MSANTFGHALLTPWFGVMQACACIACQNIHSCHSFYSLEYSWNLKDATIKTLIQHKFGEWNEKFTEPAKGHREQKNYLVHTKNHLVRTRCYFVRTGYQAYEHHKCLDFKEFAKYRKWSKFSAFFGHPKAKRFSVSHAFQWRLLLNCILQCYVVLLQTNYVVSTLLWLITAIITPAHVTKVIRPNCTSNLDRNSAQPRAKATYAMSEFGEHTMHKGRRPLIPKIRLAPKWMNVTLSRE